MSKKHKEGPAPVPKAVLENIARKPRGAPAAEQDPKRRLGNYGTAGEHSIGQPGGKQGANH
jgi:hypothetical protein